ncbi:MAG: M43 family zinc metalloprotease [Rikenellaceae bacterium]
MNKNFYIRISALAIFALVACNRENLDNTSGNDDNKNNIEVPNVCRATFENERAGVHPGVYSEEALTKARALMTKNNDPYVIPVVFHVFGTKFNNGTTVTYETIVQALKSTNEDFQGKSNDAFRSTKFGDYGIEVDNYEFLEGIVFKLANIDPKGNYTTGVNFYPEQNGFGNGGGYDDEIRKYAWDNKKYLNVYIQHDLYNKNSFTDSGVAWYPDTNMTNSNTSRVCFNGSYLDGNNEGYKDKAEEEQMKTELTGNSNWGYRNENFRSVLSHEFGHWLDLKHTFDTNTCVPYGHEGKDEYHLGDDVPDTPMVSAANALRTERNCRGEIPNWQNFMNYTDQYANFTQDQCTRMVAALNDLGGQVARKSIWKGASKVLLAYGQAGVAIVKSEFKEQSSTNDGTFADNLSLTIVGEASDITGSVGGDLTNKMTVSGLPAGLKLTLKKESINQMKLTISGKASSHEVANNTSFTITLDNGVMKNGGTINLLKKQYTINLSFIDAYKYIINPTTATVNSSNTSYNVNFGKDFTVPKLSIIFQDNAFMIDGTSADGSNGAFILCNGLTRNVKIAYSGEVLEATSTMRKITKTAKPLIYAKGVYTEWAGKTGYLAFGVPSRDGAIVYGWMKIAVSSNGASVSIQEVGYNTAPNAPVTVGAKTDGSFETSVNFEASKRSILEGDEIAFVAKALPANKVTSYSWSFPGGTPNTSKEQNPKIKYNTPGIYKVSLTVNGNLTNDKNNFITVVKKGVIVNPDDPEKPTDPDKPAEKITVEQYPATVVGIGDKDPILKNIPAGTLVSIIKGGIIVKKIKVLNDGSITVSGLNKGSYIYTYTLNDKLITRGKLEIIK